MKGTYFIGKNPRTEIPVRVVMRSGGEAVLIATSDATVIDSNSFWRNPIVRQTEIVDILGACSFFHKGTDPRVNDGGPTFRLEKDKSDDQH